MLPFVGELGGRVARLHGTSSVAVSTAALCIQPGPDRGIGQMETVSRLEGSLQPLQCPQGIWLTERTRFLQRQVDQIAAHLFIVGRGRPGRGSSASPVRPLALKPVTHLTPVTPLKPARTPASVAGNDGSASSAAMIRARITRRIGSLCALASRSISAFSAAVTGRNAIRFGIVPSLSLLLGGVCTIFVYLPREPLTGVYPMEFGFDSPLNCSCPIRQLGSLFQLPL